MPFGVNHSTATAYRGRIYVHGGYAGRGLSEPTAALLEYDPRRNRWRRLRSSPTARAAHAAAVIGDRLYVAGGADGSGSLKSMEVFDFRTRRWRGAPSFPGPARNHMTGVAVGGHFYVIGGRDESNLSGGGALRHAEAALAAAAGPAHRPRRDRIGAAVGAPHRGVRRREPGARRDHDRAGGDVRRPGAPLAAPARHAHAPPRAWAELGWGTASTRSRAGPSPASTTRGRSSSSTCAERCSRSRTTSPPGGSRS